MEDGVAALKAGAVKLAADSTLLRGGRLKALASQRLQAAEVDEAQLRLTAEGALVCPKCERPVGEVDGSGLAAATSRLEPRGTISTAARRGGPPLPAPAVVKIRRSRRRSE